MGVDVVWVLDTPDSLDVIIIVAYVCSLPPFPYSRTSTMPDLKPELEEFNGNFFEHGMNKDVLDKEVQDRKDVADVLRLQSELRLRMNYLEDANLFAGDVHKETESYPEQAW